MIYRLVSVSSALIVVRVQGDMAGAWYRRRKEHAKTEKALPGLKLMRRNPTLPG
jgi:hypothetical protein